MSGYVTQDGLFQITDEQIMQAVDLFDRLPWENHQHLSPGKGDRVTGTAAMAIAIGQVLGWSQQEIAIMSGTSMDFAHFAHKLANSVHLADMFIKSIESQFSQDSQS